MALSALDYAIISQGVQAAAREMGAKLIRSAYSTILREARDGSAALLDAQGRIVAQAELIPMQLGAMGTTLQACLALHPPETLGEDDFLINNDPYQGGQHLQDIYIFTPVFFDGRLIGFSGSVAHHLDLGGGSAGIKMGSTDVYQEGLRIPPSRYSYSRDWNGGPLERLVAANIRVPLQTIGDFNAQFAANFMGVGRLWELCRRQGADKVVAAMAWLQSYSEGRVRAAIQQVPDGRYVGEDFVDDDGLSEEPLRVRAAITVRGDVLAVDFAGTHPQVAQSINAPFSSTLSAALTAVKTVLTRDDIPFNDGVTRPISVSAPLGCMLNPRHPGPVRARMCTAYRAYSATMRALAQAVPEKVIAPGFDTTTACCLAIHSEAGFSVYVEVFGGGYGASAEADGCSGVDGPLSNCSNTPAEALDSTFGFFRLVDYALVPESFGHGRFRGGAGFLRRYEILGDGATLAIYADRFRLAPQGLFGGTGAVPGHCRILRGGQAVAIPSKASVTLRKGDVVEFLLGGGGGYGEPRQRDPRRLHADLLDGLIAAETAARIYGFDAAAE
jgi:N-methylhydantoinase B